MTLNQCGFSANSITKILSGLNSTVKSYSFINALIIPKPVEFLVNTKQSTNK